MRDRPTNQLTDRRTNPLTSGQEGHRVVSLPINDRGLFMKRWRRNAEECRWCRWCQCRWCQCRWCQCRWWHCCRWCQCCRCWWQWWSHNSCCTNHHSGVSCWQAEINLYVNIITLSLTIQNGWETNGVLPLHIISSREETRFIYNRPFPAP